VETSAISGVGVPAYLETMVDLLRAQYEEKERERVETERREAVQNQA